MITAAAFSQVVYKNFYDGIDLIFSAHEKNGMKYEYVVHPFADASLIHIAYSGDGNIELDDAGNIHSGIPGTEIIDHAPKTFYADDNQTIPSSYFLQKNSYSILTGNYDHSKTMVIDPWVVNPNFVDQNKAFDIAGDGAGAAYVFGGHNPWQLKNLAPVEIPSGPLTLLTMHGMVHLQLTLQEPQLSRKVVVEEALKRLTRQATCCGVSQTE